MKIFVQNFPENKNYRKIKSVEKKDGANISQSAHKKINYDKLSQYDFASAPAGRIISSQEKTESLQAIHNVARNIALRPKKTKNVFSGKRRVQTVHKLKELCVVLKRLPEAWLAKKHFSISRLNKHLSNESKCTAKNLTLKTNYYSSANTGSCLEKHVAGNCDPPTTRDTVLCRETVSSAIKDTVLENILCKFKTNYPEYVFKDLHVSLHKLSSHLHLYRWSQIEPMYHRCKECRSITYYDRMNQESLSHQTGLNKSLAQLGTSKKRNILQDSESALKSAEVLVQKKSQSKLHFRCLVFSEDNNNQSANKNSFESERCRKNTSVKTFTPYVLSERDFSDNEMEYPDSSYIPGKESKCVIGNKKWIHNKDICKMRNVTPVELIQAVKYAMHSAVNEPWLQLGVAGPPECCVSQHHCTVLHWMKPDIGMSDLFRNAVSQDLWLPALSLLDMIISAGAIPRPEDVQKILLLVMETEDLVVKEKVLGILQMLFRLWPPCSLHSGWYYNAVFRSPHKDGCHESNGLLISVVAVLHSQLNCQVDMVSASVTYSASVMKVVISALAADVASWLFRHRTKKRVEAKTEIPLAEIALGQTANTQIHLSNVKYIVELCVCGWIQTLHHGIFMDLVHLIAEVFRARYTVHFKGYPSLGTDCHMLAAEIVSQIEISGMESESVGNFLFILKPSWLSMLVGQKLLEKLQGPLHGSLLDIVASYILEYRDFLKREGPYVDNCKEYKVSQLDADAKKVNKRDHKGEVQLHRSCRRGNINVIRRLLAVPGVDVNIRDNAGWTPLHEAVNYGHTDCVHALLNFIPSPGRRYVYTAAQADCGTTPLTSAAVAGNADICDLLLQHTGTVLLEDVLEANDIKPELKEQIPEETQSLLKTAKLKYENIIGRHMGVSLSEEIWAHMHPLFVPLVCSHMATYYVPLIRRQFGPGCGAIQASSAHVEYSTIHQIMGILRSFEKMRKLVKHLYKQRDGPVSVLHYFQSYF